MMRKPVALIALFSLLLLTGCSDLKLSNNKLSEGGLKGTRGAGQTGYDITHQVAERDDHNQAGAIGVAVSETTSKP
jgi:hypothetical protein